MTTHPSLLSSPGWPRFMVLSADIRAVGAQQMANQCEGGDKCQKVGSAESGDGER